MRANGPELAGMPVGKKISYWARSFLGTPYDTDPLGRYVRLRRIVVDDAVDCIYLTFRSTELAMSSTPDEAAEKALELRFITKGKRSGALVENYGERFKYGEDMIDSGKWGTEITSKLARTVKIKGTRGRGDVAIIPRDGFLTIAKGNASPLRDGDIVFFIMPPEKRRADEIVGHIGIVEVKDGTPYLIHASGRKNSAKSKGNGSVRSVSLPEYAKNMRFIGVRLTRFEQPQGGDILPRSQQ